MRIQTLLILAATLTLGLEAQAGTINVQFNNATNYTGPAVISSGSNIWNHGTGGIVVDSTGAVVLAGGSGVTVSLGGLSPGSRPPTHSRARSLTRTFTPLPRHSSPSAA